MPVAARSASEFWLDPVLAAGLVAAASCAFWFPQRVLALTPDCLVTRAVGGGRCWGCGITHAIVELIHLDFRGAVSSNPLVLLVAPLLAWTSMRFVWRTTSRALGSRR